MNLDDIISNNQELVYSIVYRFKSKEVDDLYQAGCIGLIKAYYNYNPSYQTKFSTYAYPYIVGEIYKYLNYNQTIRLNNEHVKLMRNIKKAEEVLTQRLYRVPSDVEIANFLEIDLMSLSQIRNIIHIDSLDYEYEENNLFDYIPIENMDKETLIDLKNALSKLTKEERKLISQRYFYNMSQMEVAHELMTNQVKVSREEKRVLSKMKSFMVE